MIVILLLGRVPDAKSETKSSPPQPTITSGNNNTLRMRPPPPPRFRPPPPPPITCMCLYKTIRRGLEVVHLKQHRPLHTVPADTYRHHSKLRRPVNTPIASDILVLYIVYT